MWQARLKLYHSDCPIVNRCKKFNVVVYSYPSSWYREGRKKYTTQICFMQGKKEDKQAYVLDMSKDPAVKRLEAEGDLFTYQYELSEEGQHVQLYYDARMVLIKPVVNSPEGFEYWEVASWDKTFIQKFIDDLMKNMDYCELQKIVDASLKDVYFPNLGPRLSLAQKKAIELAYAEGYYEYPKKTSIKKLAVKAGVSQSTFQEHLRKAEIKIIPLLFKHHFSPEEKELVVKTRLKQVMKIQKISSGMKKK